MMKNRKYKVIRDNIHGYIRIPEDYVELFVDTELFQRLRSIEQTGMRILYPTARHDRFSHSLGVFYLGSEAFRCFKANVEASYKNTHYSVYKDEKKNELFWDRCQVLFEIACLLHDCGHSPFSHTLEYIYDATPVDKSDSESGTESAFGLKEKLKNYNGSRDFEKDFQGNGAPHERMSALLVCSEYKESIDRLLIKYGLDSVDDTSPTEFVSRMIIGCRYSLDSRENSIKNCLITLLNSDTIDVDSLDYIVRDARMSGIDNVSIDTDRLLNSLTLVETTSFSGVQLHDQYVKANILSGELSSDVNNARCRGKVNGKLNALDLADMSAYGAVSISGNLRIKEPFDICDGKHLKKIIRIGGTEFKDGSMTPEGQNQVQIKGIVTEKKKLKVDGSSANFDETTNAQIDLTAKKVKFTTTEVNATLNGRFKGELVGNHSNIRGGKLKCVLGFHKSSLSVIQNVIIARNYEYQWIYSHHKVAYYANYLLVELLKECIRFLASENGDFPSGHLYATDYMAHAISWRTMVSERADEPGCGPYDAPFGISFFRPTDSDILSLFKTCQIKIKTRDESAEGEHNCVNSYNRNKIADLIEQYSTRRYRKSLWKSYAEMCNYLSEFTTEQIADLYELFVDKSHGSIKNTNYGYLDDEWEKCFRDFGMDDVVWVNGTSKMKVLDPTQTFIHFKDRDMTYGSVCSPADAMPMGNYTLFYIYYRPVEGQEVQKDSLIEFLKEQLKNP